MNHRAILKVAVVLVILAGTVGCANREVDLAEGGQVKIQVVPSETIDFDQVNVHQHGNQMEIEVIVRPAERVRQFGPQKIKVEIKDPEGADFSFIQSQQVRDHHRMFSKLQHAHFWVRLPYTPSAGTVVRVSHLAE